MVDLYENKNETNETKNAISMFKLHNRNTEGKE